MPASPSGRSKRIVGMINLCPSKESEGGIEIVPVTLSQLNEIAMFSVSSIHSKTREGICACQL